MLLADVHTLWTNPQLAGGQVLVLDGAHGLVFNHGRHWSKEVRPYALMAETAA